MVDKEIVIVAKCFDSSVSGPASVVRELIAELKREQVSFHAVLLTERQSKYRFLIDLVSTLKNEDGLVVNVHTDGYLIPFAVLFLSKIFWKHSYYLTVHGIYQIERAFCGKSKYRYVLLEKYIYKRFPNLICVSQMLKQNIQVIFGRSDNVLVIPNATNAHSDVRKKKNIPMELISLGGLRKCKGIECVLKLASVFKEKTCCFHISLYGAAENNLDWFQKQVMELNLTGLIDYYGEITDKQKVYDIIRQADIQLCFSKYDTYNVAIAESLVLGCPCIASNMCGAAYLINDYSAGLVVDLDEESAGNFGNIIEYFNNIGNVESYGKTNNDYVDLLSWKNVVSQYLSLS